MHYKVVNTLASRIYPIFMLCAYTVLAVAFAGAIVYVIGMLARTVSPPSAFQSEYRTLDRVELAKAIQLNDPTYMSVDGTTATVRVEGIRFSCHLAAEDGSPVWCVPLTP